MYQFAEKKFLGLPERQQHKKCAELLRYIYDVILSNQDAKEFIAHYNELQNWMKLPVLTDCNPKLLANRYHEHLERANVHIRENQLLPHVTKRDRPVGDPPLPIAIYLDKTRSAFNVGSIIRTAEAMAIGTLYFADSTPFVDNRQVQNTSMDAYRWIECKQKVPLSTLPKPIIALETSPDAIPLHQFIFPESFTLVLGNEEYGCSDETLSAADYLVQIPLNGKKNSLNVASAFAIAAAEIRRQKNIANVRFF